MNTGSITLLLLLGGSTCFRLDASRTKHSKRAPEGEHYHKCTITWPKVGTWPADRAETPASTVSFEVESCTAGCKATVDQDHFNNKFWHGFQAVETSSGRCSCQTMDGRELFKFSTKGSCGETEVEKLQAKKTCFSFYKKMATNELTANLTVIPHTELYAEDTFDYTCETDACNDADCWGMDLHTQWEIRNEKDHRLLADLVSKVANADTDGLDGVAKLLVGELSAEDLQKAGELAVQEKMDGEPGFSARLEAVKKYGSDLLDASDDDDEAGFEWLRDDDGFDWEAEAKGVFDSILDNSENKDGTITADELKKKYKEMLEGTAVHVDSLLKIAGITEEKHITFDQFKCVAKPDCNRLA